MKFIYLLKNSGKRIVITFLAFVMIFTGIPTFSQPTAAIGCDEDFYSNNNILYYNPCAAQCSTGVKTTVSIVTKLKGENNAEKVFNYWIDSGLSIQQAAAITASIKNVSGFSAFHQQDSQDWPDGGWGIASFSNDRSGSPINTSVSTGQRDAATAFVSSSVTKPIFDKYYKAEYGGVVLESNGFIPDSINKETNDRFLLAELNYLSSYIKQLSVSSLSDKVSVYQQDTGQTADVTKTFYDYFITLTKPVDTASAWTYLYEYPTNGIGLKESAAARVNQTSEIIKLYSKGISTGCGGGLVEGGMTLDQAKEFMNVYKTSADSTNYLGGAGRGCTGGPLANCVSFSVYFINKYTSLKGMGSGTLPGSGWLTAKNAASRNPDVESGTEPRPYSIFSYGSGPDGHTGIILGVDLERGKVIVGDAGCSHGSTAQKQLDRIHATEQDISKYSSGQYFFLYASDLLKEGIE